MRESLILRCDCKPILSQLRALSVATLLILSACSTMPPVVGQETDAPLLPPVRSTLPQPAPLQQNPFEVQSTTIDGTAVFTLTPEAYSVLEHDLTDMLRYIRETKWLLDYYEGKHDGDAQPTGAMPSN